MPVKHVSRVSQVIITQFGELKLDANGVVTNLKEVKAKEEDVAKLPTFELTDVFPVEPKAEVVEEPKDPEPDPKKDPEPDPKKDPEPDPKKDPEPADKTQGNLVEGKKADDDGEPKDETPEEGIRRIVQFAIENEFPTNSEGFLDIDALNAKLREENLPILTGTRRKEIETKVREALKAQA